MHDVIDDVVARPVPAADRIAPVRHGGGPHRLARLVRAGPPMVVAAVLIIPGISNRAMWSDEYVTWYAASLSRTDLLRLLGQVDAVLAPYYAFMKVWIHLFGSSEASLRMPSAVAMVAAAGMTTLLGERLFSATIGVGAGLLFAILPTVSRYGQEARPYGLAVAAALISTLLLLRALDRPDWSRWWIYGIASTTIVFTHFVAILILGAHLVAVVLTGRQRHDFRYWRWTGVVAVVITACLPLVAKGSSQSDAIGWIRANLQATEQFPGKLFGSTRVALTVAGLAGCGFGLWWSRQRSAVLVLATWAVLPVVFCYLTFPVLHLFLYRYLLFTLPGWCLLATAAGVGLVRRLLPERPVRNDEVRVFGPPDGFAGVDRTRLGAGLAAVAVALVVIGTGYIGLPGQTVARSQILGEPDYRAAAIVVSQRMRPGDGIAYASTIRNGRRSFAYELRDRPQPRDVFLATTSQQLGTFAALECGEPGRCVRDTTRIWLVLTEPTGGDLFKQMPRAIAQLLRDEFAPGLKVRLSNVSVVLLTRAG